jgi:deoxyribodipyrimidine photo-lyase
MEVDGDSVVPLEVASEKAEYAARTIRPKVHAHLDRFLVELRPTPLERDSLDLGRTGIDLSDPSAILDRLRVDASTPPVTHFFRGGTREALKRMRHFRNRRLKDYADARSRPEEEAVSRLSPYLHFGQISPVEVALELGRGRYGKREDRDAYLEELCVRRTLAQNFVWFCPDYDSYAALPDWARATLDAHRADERAARYSKRELETARTHDPYWNAAMREMRYTGYMHNHMRMYWGKKILEWTNTPEYAYRVALELNNRYFLDGRDPNSYANIGWIFGLHDRPWPERDVYGKVRTMTAKGLERKMDIDAYVKRVDELVTEARAAGIVFDND